ncbi:MAG: ABC transporter ATP-binding protein [Pseudomonadota bacterium]
MTALLQIERLTAGYRPDMPILHAVSASLSAGEIATIIGPNGAGKSTLIKAVSGLVTVTAGRVLLEGQDITATPPHRLAPAGVAYVPQTGNVFTTLSIAENLSMGAATLPRRQARARIEAVCADHPMLAERLGEKAAVLSGGQRQILAIARALVTQPRLILLDEPTAGLAPRAAAELFAVVRGLVTAGAGVLMVEQNAKAALRISDRGYVLAEGRNRAEGPAAALLDDPEIGAIFLGQRRAHGASATPDTAAETGR